MATLNHLGHQRLIVGATAVKLAMPSAPGGISHRPHRALLRCVANPVRWLATGTNPAGDNGSPILAGEIYREWMDPRDGVDFYGVIVNAAFVRDITAAGDAILEVDFYS